SDLSRISVVSLSRDPIHQIECFCTFIYHEYFWFSCFPSRSYRKYPFVSTAKGNGKSPPMMTGFNSISDSLQGCERYYPKMAGAERRDMLRSPSGLVVQRVLGHVLDR